MAEWVLATWMNYLDPNILGIRQVEEEKSGGHVSMLHIAIPLEYRRRELAFALGIGQIEDGQHASRINLISSPGHDQSHSYVRIPSEVVVSRVLELIRRYLLEEKDINDQTIHMPRSAVGEYSRTPQAGQREENVRLRSAVQEALARRNASLEPHQIQIMIHKKTGEKWIRIARVDRSKRTSIKLAIKQVGIHTTPASKGANGDSEWALHFTAREAQKMLFL